MLAYMEKHLTEENLLYQVAEALDLMQGMEAQVMHRRFLADHSHEQIALDLGLSEAESLQLAASGLRRIKEYVFGA